MSSYAPTIDDIHEIAQIHTAPVTAALSSTQGDVAKLQTNPTRYFSATTDRPRHAELNDALAQAGHVYLGPGRYVLGDHIDIPSNTRLQLHPNAVIVRDASMPLGTQMIRLVRVSNVIIEGGVIDGNRAEGFGGFGQVAGIATQGVTNVVIRDIEIKNVPSSPESLSYGYGLYLGSYGPQPNVDVLVSNVHAHDCGQDNLHVASGQNIVFENCHSHGADYLGFDIEPGVDYERVQNLIIRGCVIEHNAQGGLSCNNHFRGYWHDVLMEGCVLRGNTGGGAVFTGSGQPLNLRVRDSVFINNVDNGLEVNGVVNAVVNGCEASGNLKHGIRCYENANFVVRDCHAINNARHGIVIEGEVLQDFKALVTGNGCFNNGENGIHVDMNVDAEEATLPTRVHIAQNRTGNAAEVGYPAWAGLTSYFDDQRVTNGGNVYEMVPPEDPLTLCVSAASGGPTGTGRTIADANCVWRYIGPVTTQQRGIGLDGDGARGVVLTRNADYDNALGFIWERPQGDPNTLFTADVLESQTLGQTSAPLTRSRAIAMEDKSGTPGDVTSFYGGGRAAIAAGANTMAISTPFAKPGDLVQVTQEAPDTTLTKLYAKVTADGVVTVRGDALATAAVPFAWEVIKAGSFTYDS